MNLDQFFEQFRAYAAKMHGRQAEDMYMHTAMQEMASVDTMMEGLPIAVGDIAAISLLVDGIGITNIVLVFVTERTREIGIREALGVRTQDVLIQFLTRSAILSAYDGIIGVVTSVGLVSLEGLTLGTPVTMKPGVTLVAVPSSAAVSTFFGLYPASKAAKSDPVDTLRYE